MENLNPQYDSEELAAGRKLPGAACTFVLGVASLNQLPPDDQMEESLLPAVPTSASRA